MPPLLLPSNTKPFGVIMVYLFHPLLLRYVNMNAAVRDMNAAVRDMNAAVRRSYVDPCRGRGLLFQASACEGGRILHGLYMDEASTAASTEANTRVHAY